MPRALFLVPMEGEGTRDNPYRGKYTRDSAVTTAGALRFGHTDSAIIMLDATQTYLDTVAGAADSTLLATQANIDSTLTAGQANVAKAVFESLGIPGDFINSGDTRRQAIRGVVGAFLFSQRMEGRFGASWRKRAQDAGVSLDTQFSNMPQSMRDEFINLRDENGWGNLGLSGTSTLRQMMVAVSSQYESTPIFIGGQQI